MSCQLLQQQLVDEYLKIKENPSLKAISEDTGIQITRVYRILKGSEMKLSEYEIFLSKVRSINLFQFNSSDFLNIAKACLAKLSVESLREVEMLMERKILSSDLVNIHVRK